MKTNEILKILKVKCGKFFLGVFPKDRIPMDLPTGREFAIICNTDNHNRPGQHWIALYVNPIKKRGEYFDSFGEKPLEIFEKLLSKYCSNWKYNKQLLQSVVSEACGQFAIFYVLFKYLGYDLESIVQCFSSDTALNEFIAQQFIRETS